MSDLVATPRGQFPSPSGGWQADIPSPSDGGQADIPSPSGRGQADIPSPSDGGQADIPSPSGGGQGGGLVQIADLSPGSALPELRKEPVTKVQLVKYAGASGDYNLIHTDDETARQVGLDGVIAHGMLSMAFLGQYLCWLSGSESVRRLTARFKAMVRPGDVLTCKGRVKSLATEAGEHRLALEVWAENQRGEQVTVGDAEVVVR
jgi:acyl dehydratase